MARAYRSARRVGEGGLSRGRTPTGIRHDLDVVAIDPERNGAGCLLDRSDADSWHARMAATGLPVTPISDQPWGMREFTLTDPSGNNVRIGRSAG